MTEPLQDKLLILVVEDDPGDFGLVRVHLRQAGFGHAGGPEPRWAKTLAEGMAAALSGRPDAILLDVAEFRAAAKDGRAVRQIDKGIELEAAVLALLSHAPALTAEATRLSLLTPASRNALTKLSAGKFPLPPADLRAMGDLLDRMAASGFDPASLTAADRADGRTSSSLKLTSSAIRTVRI